MGAGVAGLTAAIALQRRGFDALVFERVDDLGRIQTGSGLALGYNVARTFRHLDLLEQVEEFAERTTYFQYATDTGRVLGTVEVPEGELQLGVVRSALHRCLAAAVAEGTIQLGARLERFEQDSGSITAYFSDGREVRGAALIGADGIHSVVRRQLLGEVGDPLPAGYTARRGVIETDLVPYGRFRMAMGRGKRFVYYRVGRDLIYWTAITNEPPGSPVNDPVTLKRRVLENFAGWAEPTEALVEATEDSNTFQAEIHDRDPVERWGEGRVTLLGDAAQPTTFNIGQGAGQAIEGAAYLGQYLSGADDVAAGLRRYEAARIPRTSKIVSQSRRVGNVGQWENPVACFLRNNVLAKIVLSVSGTQIGVRDLQIEFD